MKKNNAIILTLILLFFLSNSKTIFALEDFNFNKQKDHRVGAFIGYNYYPGGGFNNNRSFFAASLGLEYDYKFSNTWGIGVKMDFVFSKYTIPSGVDLPDIIIYYPSIMAKYYISQSFDLLAGPGIEIIEGEVHSTFKIGAEFKFKLPNNWDFKPIFSFSEVSNFENTYEIVFSIGKNL